MEWLILLVFLVLGALFFGKVLLSFFLDSRGASDEFPYEKKKALFTPAERSFFGVLDQAVKDQAIVFGKVRVADILYPSKGMQKSDYWKARNLILSKHFDYVICDPNDLSILAVVELDDKSHAKRNRAERDIFLEKACLSAKLPLHRFKASAAYSTKKIRDAVFSRS